MVVLGVVGVLAQGVVLDDRRQLRAGRTSTSRSSPMLCSRWRSGAPSRRRLVAAERDVAALQQRLHAGVSERLHQLAQLRHRDVVPPPTLIPRSSPIRRVTPTACHSRPTGGWGERAAPPRAIRRAAARPARAVSAAAPGPRGGAAPAAVAGADQRNRA